MNEYLIGKLKEGRLNKGFKQSDVTKFTGIKNTTLSNYENGNTEPDMDTFLQLCELYELDYASLLAEAYGYKIHGLNFDIKKSEIDHIKKYRELDSHGKEMVDIVLNKESERCSLIIENQKYDVQRAATKLLAYYRGSVAAGSGIYQLDSFSEQLEVPLDDLTAKADFILDVNGDSMNPNYRDGDKVLVSQRESVDVGDTGIFVINGKSYIKDRGADELISTNENYPNIKINEFDNVVCFGKVIGKLDTPYEQLSEMDKAALDVGYFSNTKEEKA